MWGRVQPLYHTASAGRSVRQLIERADSEFTPVIEEKDPETLRQMDKWTERRTHYHNISIKHIYKKFEITIPIK